MMAFNVPRPIVKLSMPTDVPGILVKCKDINDKVTLHAALFPDLPVTAADNKTHIEKAFTAEGAMQNPDTDKTNIRNNAVALILSEAFAYHDYVQTLATATPADAAALAIAAGMELKGFTKRGKQVWSVKYTGISQEVELTATIKGKRCAYEWQQSATPDDLPSWRVTEITTTLQSTTIATGLPVGKDIYFRFRIILKDGPTQWSDPIKVHII